MKLPLRVTVRPLFRFRVETNHRIPDIVDIKPINMEELTEVITAAEFHPKDCNLLAYSSSKGIIRLCDMRVSALCDGNPIICKSRSLLS